MSTKPSALSVLKNLPEERLAEIWSRMTEKTATWKNTSYAAVRRWLKEDGVETSITALGDFYSWYPLHQQFHQDEVTVDTLLAQLKQEMPNLSEEQIDDMGQRTFSLLSIRRQDLEGFVSVRSARSKAELEKAKLKLREAAETRLQQQAELAREKFEVSSLELYLKWRKNRKMEELADLNISNAAKIEAMRREAFRSVDELQASGAVKIPKP